MTSSRLPLDPKANARNLGATLRRLEELLRQRDELQKEIEATKKNVRVLSSLCELSTEHRMLLWRIDQKLVYSDSAEGKLAHEVKTVLQQAGGPVSPQFIRERLERDGFDFSEYIESSTAIHRLLLRLIDKGQVRKLGRATYEWASENPIPDSTSPEAF